RGRRAARHPAAPSHGGARVGRDRGRTRAAAGHRPGAWVPSQGPAHARDLRRPDGMTRTLAASRPAPPVPARGIPALLAAVPFAVALDIVLPAVWGARAGWPFVLQTIAYVVIWVAVGWVACRLRPDRRMGRLMILFGILTGLSAIPGFGLRSSGLAFKVGGAISIALAPVQIAFIGHLLLAFPSGKLTGSGSRWWVRAAYGYALVEAGVWLLAFRPHSLSCRPLCAPDLPNV